MEKIAIVSTLRAPLQQTLSFVRYHLHIGIDALFLFFDDPDDPALETLASCSQVTATACSPAYWRELGHDAVPGIGERQNVNANVGMIMALQHSCQWLLHIDCDELVRPCGDVHEILAGCRVDVLKLSLLEAVPEAEEHDHVFSPVLFKKMISARQKRMALLLRCHGTFFEGAYFRGHTASKTAVRLGPGITRMGVHAPITREGMVRESTGRLSLLHFGCIGLAEWVRKWERRVDGTAVSAGISSSRSKQFDYYLEARSAGDLALRKAYSRLYLLSRYQRFILRLLGMTTTIRLDQRLFE